jgi:hypothetical protein
MFRTAAVVHLFFGLAAVWRYGLTAHDPTHRPAGIAFGVLTVIVGVSLFKPAKFAIVMSAIGCAVIAVCAAIGAPIVHGPVIIAFALVAIVSGLYAVLATRVLFGRGS